jgi:hypothetical protein
MIVKQYRQNNIKILFLSKIIDEITSKSLEGLYIKKEDVELIINEDTDAYDYETNKLIFRFRKNKLNKTNLDLFYDNVIKYANHNGNDRLIANGMTRGRCKSNIIGFIDKLNPGGNKVKREQNIKLECNIRPNVFMLRNTDKYNNLIPLIKDLDYLYKKFCDYHYKKQKKLADETLFKIDDTAFTTITTNINFTTSIHTDIGDYKDGLGVITVIQKGEYTGGEFCLINYGVGINIQQYDVLFVDVALHHANLPIILENNDSIRLSIIAYFRTRIHEKTKNFTKEQYIKHLEKIKKMYNI